MCFNAVLPRGGAPRWQPLMVHLAAAKWRNASQVSWQATVVTTEDSYDEGVAVAVIFLAVQHLQPVISCPCHIVAVSCPYTQSGSSFIRMVFSSSFLRKSWQDEIIRAENQLVLQKELYTVVHTYILSPILHANVFTFFPHRSYAFTCYGRGERGVLFFTFSFKIIIHVYL
jgi:hypothetical protein